jgi:23S rRNA pseudouridine1911/1915/1917 synthase
MIYTVTDADKGKRLDAFLSEAAGISRSAVAKLIDEGLVTVNGKTQPKKYAVKLGDEIDFTPPEIKEAEALPENIPLDVVYEDDYIIAVNKPKNMPTHPSKGNNLPTLANGIMAYFGGNHTFRSINRLDRDTSGIVLMAKDAYSAAALSSSMKKGEFKKKYIAKIAGVPKEKHGIIDAPIRRESEGEMKRIVADDGKRAVTEYTVLCDNGENSLVEVLLHTGRTHQIRVHFSHIGHPLVGDFLYGERIENESYSLHCFELILPHPKTKETLVLRAKCEFEL